MAHLKSFKSGALLELFASLGVRRFSLPVLVLIGGAMFQALWHLVDSVSVLAWLAGMATPFCMVCATFVWGMRDRFDAVADVELFTAREYQDVSSRVGRYRARATWWSGFAAVAGLIASASTVSHQLMGVVWQWMFVMCGAAVAVACYAYILAAHWDAQLRRSKTKRVLEKKAADERRKIIEEMSKHGATSKGKGWVEGPAWSASTTHTH